MVITLSLCLIFHHLGANRRKSRIESRKYKNYLGLCKAKAKKDSTYPFKAVKISVICKENKTVFFSEITGSIQHKIGKLFYVKRAENCQQGH